MSGHRHMTLWSIEYSIGHGRASRDCSNHGPCAFVACMATRSICMQCQYVRYLEHIILYRMVCCLFTLVAWLLHNMLQKCYTLLRWNCSSQKYRKRFNQLEHSFTHFPSSVSSKTFTKIILVLSSERT